MYLLELRNLTDWLGARPEFCAHMVLLVLIMNFRIECF